VIDTVKDERSVLVRKVDDVPVARIIHTNLMTGTCVHREAAHAEGLYRFTVSLFHQGRAFVLELAVVLILVIELEYLFHSQVGYR
jgi:hypothetical protein